MSEDQDNRDLESLQNDVERWLDELDRIPADPDFMKERNQPRAPKREIFD